MCRIRCRQSADFIREPFLFGEFSRIEGRFGFFGSVAAAPASARRGEDSGKRSVLVQTVEKRENNRQTAAAQDTFAETSVFRAQNEQRNENPKGGVTLCAAIHKIKTSCVFTAGDM